VNVKHSSTVTVLYLTQPCESCQQLRSCQLIYVDGQTFAVCETCAMGGDAA